MNYSGNEKRRLKESVCLEVFLLNRVHNYMRKHTDIVLPIYNVGKKQFTT